MNIRDEVELHWAENKCFLPGTTSKTVSEVYNLYQTGKMAFYYKPDSHAKSKKATGSHPQFEMALEMYINKPMVC